MKVTKISTKGINLIKKWESFQSKPYRCSSGVPTIGYGNTFYTNGKKVSLLDSEITEQEAVKLLKDSLEVFEKNVDSFCRDDINQNQFDALVSFAFNVGPYNLKKSTLLKKVNLNPNDSTIKDEFLRWTKSNGKTLKGLVKRREEEANLYFNGDL
jgi:lysozyme